MDCWELGAMGDVGIPEVEGEEVDDVEGEGDERIEDNVEHDDGSCGCGQDSSG